MRTFILSTLLLLTVHGFSQKPKRVDPKLIIKAKAGVNLSHVKRFYGGYYLDHQVKTTNFHGGVVAELPLHNKVTAQAELMYTQKGYRDTTPAPTMSRVYFNPFRSYSFGFHYIEIPVMIRYKFAGGLRLGIGPSVGYLVDYEHFLHNRKTDGDFKITKLDYSVLGDISYSISRVEISARYVNGLRQINYREPYDPEFNRGGLEPIGKNRSVQFSVSYTFIK